MMANGRAEAISAFSPPVVTPQDYAQNLMNNLTRIHALSPMAPSALIQGARYSISPAPSISNSGNNSMVMPPSSFNSSVLGVRSRTGGSLSLIDRYYPRCGSGRCGGGTICCRIGESEYDPRNACVSGFNYMAECQALIERYYGADNCVTRGDCQRR